MRRPLGDVCLDIASFARERKHEFLSYILRLAAAEAYQATADEDGFEVPVPRRLARALIVGVWDWDISNDRNYLDAGAARLFSVDPELAARGLPYTHYLSAVHPDDLGRVQASLASAMKTGGSYECEYRLCSDGAVRWVLARGSCTLDHHDRPVRLPGVLIDISFDKAMN